VIHWNIVVFLIIWLVNHRQFCKVISLHFCNSLTVTVAKYDFCVVGPFKVTCNNLRRSTTFTFDSLWIASLHKSFADHAQHDYSAFFFQIAHVQRAVAIDLNEFLGRFTVFLTSSNSFCMQFWAPLRRSWGMCHCIYSLFICIIWNGKMKANIFITATLCSA